MLTNQGETDSVRPLRRAWARQSVGKESGVSPSRHSFRRLATTERPILGAFPIPSGSRAATSIFSFHATTPEHRETIHRNPLGPGLHRLTHPVGAGPAGRWSSCTSRTPAHVTTLMINSSPRKAQSVRKVSPV